MQLHNLKVGLCQGSAYNQKEICISNLLGLELWGLITSGAYKWGFMVYNVGYISANSSIHTVAEEIRKNKKLYSP